jgi:hypothetical protein
MHTLSHSKDALSKFWLLCCRMICKENFLQLGIQRRKCFHDRWWMQCVKRQPWLIICFPVAGQVAHVCKLIGFDIFIWREPWHLNSTILLIWFSADYCALSWTSYEKYAFTGGILWNSSQLEEHSSNQYSWCKFSLGPAIWQIQVIQKGKRWYYLE